MALHLFAVYTRGFLLKGRNDAKIFAGMSSCSVSRHVWLCSAVHCFRSRVRVMCVPFRNLNLSILHVVLTGALVSSSLYMCPLFVPGLSSFLQKLGDLLHNYIYIFEYFCHVKKWWNGTNTNLVNNLWKQNSGLLRCINRSQLYFYPFIFENFKIHTHVLIVVTRFCVRPVRSCRNLCEQQILRSIQAWCLWCWCYNLSDCHKVQVRYFYFVN